MKFTVIACCLFCLTIALTTPSVLSYSSRTSASSLSSSSSSRLTTASSLLISTIEPTDSDDAADSSDDVDSSDDTLPVDSDPPELTTTTARTSPSTSSTGSSSTPHSNVSFNRTTPASSDDEEESSVDDADAGVETSSELAPVDSIETHVHTIESSTGPSTGPSRPPLKPQHSSGSAEELESDEAGAEDDEDGDADEDSEETIVGTNRTRRISKEERSLRKLQTFLQSSIETLLKSAMPSLVRSSYETNVSSVCTSSFLQVMRGLQAGQQWAFSLLDSSGKPPSGILEGTLTDFGSFEQCLSIDTFKEEPKEAFSFAGKYCILDVKPAFETNIPAGSNPPGTLRNDSVIWHPALQIFWSRNNLLSFRYGMCVPSVCSQEDLRQLTSYFFKPTGLEADVSNCQQSQPIQITAVQLAVICCLFLIFLSVFVGTCLEMVLQTLDKDKLLVSSKKSLVNFLISFSLIKNTRKLLSSSGKVTNSSGSPGISLRHLDGVRFLSTCWIIMGHTYFFTDFVHYHHFRNLADFRLLDDNFWFMPIANFTLSVDTFFFISGMLVVYTNWKKLTQNKGRINAIDFMIHRVWRIWPPYMVTIAAVLVLPLLGSGPLWPQAVQNSAAVCRENWWQNLLFINNFQKPDDVCMFHTWFLSANIQFHLAAIVILFLLVRFPKSCIFLMSIGVVACIGGIYYYAEINHLRIPTVIADDVFVDNEDKILMLYVAPYNHFASYLIGIIFGYYMTTRHTITFTSRQRNVGWTISLALLAAVIFTPYRAFKGEPVSQLFSSLYLSLHRPIWAVCFGWLVVSCATGHGGFIDRLLAYRFFRAPSALSYLAYLIHPVLMLYHTGNVRERVYLSHYLFLNTFLARTVLAFAAAYLLYVTVELPFAQLERYVFPRRNRSKTAATTIPCNATIGRPIHMIMHSESSSCGNCRKPLPDSGASSLLSGRTLSLGLSASDASVLHADSLHGPCGFYRPRTCDQPPIHSHPATSASFVTRTTSASSSSSASHRGTHH